MSTLAEIKTAIAKLNTHDRALLTAEMIVLAEELASDDSGLQSALARGLGDAEAGRVRPVEDTRKMIPAWTTKS